jgi:hypothetical protein
LFFQLFNFNTFSHFFDNKTQIVRFKLFIFTKQIKTNMKKTVLFLATALTLVFASCKKDDKTTSITLPAEDIAAGTAIVKGILKANTDATNTSDETVSGERIVVVIDTKDWYLNPTPGKTYPVKRYETTTGADGTFEIRVDVSNNRKLTGVTVTAIEFLKNKIESTTSTKLYKWVYSPGTLTIGDLFVGEVKHRILTMDGTPFN